MNQTKDDHTPLPGWALELIAKVESMSFAADDEELDFACSPIKMAICEAEAPFDKLDELDEEDKFAVELMKLIQSKWTGTKRELCEWALLHENTFYKIQAGRRTPGRDTIINLALALGLKVKEARRLLGYHGYGLSEHIKRDFIILHCLEMGKKPMDVNTILADRGLRLLGNDD